MTKIDLIRALDGYNEDDIVIISSEGGGWCNIDSVQHDGCCICIVEDTGRPFSSE